MIDLFERQSLEHFMINNIFARARTLSNVYFYYRRNSFCELPFPSNRTNCTPRVSNGEIVKAIAYTYIHLSNSNVHTVCRSLRRDTCETDTC